MARLNFKATNLEVDYLTLRIPNLLMENEMYLIASYFFNHLKFNSNYKVKNTIKKQFYWNETYDYTITFRRYSIFNSNGTLIQFSGVNAKQIYNLIKDRKIDWQIFNKYSLELGRVDLCYVRPNHFKHNQESFDNFLVDSRHHILKTTRTRNIILEDNESGKILKVNQRANPYYYRVYEKDDTVRFELEIKHRQATSVQDCLFNNQFDKFEHRLTTNYYNYTKRIFPFYNTYIDWVRDFARKNSNEQISGSFLFTSYLENTTQLQEEEERFFHLLQFLSFIKKLNINPDKDCQKYFVKNQCYYNIEFSLSQFVSFTGIKISNKSQREKFLAYFQKLQAIEPIANLFSDGSFRSYVIFPIVEIKRNRKKQWVIEVAMAKQFFTLRYPFRFPNSFLISKNKNDLLLKVRLIQSLSSNDEQKTFYFEQFCDQVSVTGKRMVQIKKNMIELFQLCVEQKFIKSELEIIYKSGKKRHIQIEELTTSIVTRRIQSFKFNENKSILYRV